MRYTFTTLLSIYINKLTYYIEGELPVVKCIFKSRPLTFKKTQDLDFSNATIGLLTDNV